MSSWDTNPWSNFWDPPWELICRIIIHTTGNSCRDALRCTNMALKVPWYFYLLMEKPLSCYFQIWSLYYQAAQCTQKTPILLSWRWQIRSEKAKKKKKKERITINTNHSYHEYSFPQAVSTDLTVKPDSVLTNLVGKNGMWSWLI